MVLTTIFAIRHGFRPAFNTNPTTGEIKASYPSPTGISTDPALTSYGVKQAEELASLASTLSPPVARIYTSPAYRCIQTIAPLAARIPHVPVISDAGLWDWFGKAFFEYPAPAEVSVLHKFFPGLSEHGSLDVSRSGETLDELQHRVAYVMARIIADADAKCTATGPEAIIVSTHAAVLITLGRALTGRVPEDCTEKDFDTYTCSVSTYLRRKAASKDVPPEWKHGDGIPQFRWKGTGVGGGWDCTVNAAVGHLTNGGERNWHFSGDEGFVDAMKTSDIQEDGGNSIQNNAKDYPSRL